MRVTILWPHWSGYMDACARALAEHYGCTVDVTYIPAESNAPFEKDQFFRYPGRAFAVDPFRGELPPEVANNPPDVILICSWHMPVYRRFAVKLAGRSTRVLCMDNQWLASAHQFMGVLAAPFFIQPAYDFAFVPGRRQAAFARRLGFQNDRIYEGHYACDYEALAPRYDERLKRPLSRSFMFVGRLVPAKAIDTLMQAWETFVSSTDFDWRLKIVGGGSYSRRGRLPPRVEMVGFVQPDALPNKLLDGDVFVLPSNSEPWGLVIHEAAATGMPIICSDACGAGDAFVENGVNGVVVRRGDVAGLAEAFHKFGTLDEGALRAMGATSARLAARRTPATWAGQVVAMAKKIRNSSLRLNGLHDF